MDCLDRYRDPMPYAKARQLRAEPHAPSGRTAARLAGSPAPCGRLDTRLGRWWRTSVPSLLACLVVLAVAACRAAPPPPPPQPIAFDHSKHAQHGITCVQCHDGVEKGARAGLPPLSRCASCHYGVEPDNPEIKKIFASYEAKKPLFWRKVNVMPPSAMVHFKHSPHIRAGVPCSACHGAVETMTVARRVIDTADMGFCIDCHRLRGASVDCVTCHH